MRAWPGRLVLQCSSRGIKNEGEIRIRIWRVREQCMTTGASVSSSSLCYPADGVEPTDVYTLDPYTVTMYSCRTISPSIPMSAIRPRTEPLTFDVSNDLQYLASVLPPPTLCSGTATMSEGSALCLERCHCYCPSGCRPCFADFAAEDCPVCEAI